MNTVPWDSTTADGIIDGFGARPEMLLQILVAFVERFGWIEEAAILQLAERLNLSRADVHGVVSYYHDLRTAPPGRHVIKLCQAESCQAMGARELAIHAERVLGVRMHETTADVTLEPVYCLGNCACSPAIAVNGRPYGRVDAARFDAIVAGLAVDGR